MSIKQKIKFKPVIERLDLTAEDWDLFSDNPHAEAVAENLNNTFMACVNQGYNKHQTIVKMTHIMNINRKLGANDTEPRRVLDELLEAVFPAG